MLVILRLSLGCHFLFEGLYKINEDDFSAKPFLQQAKGPLAPVFYSMVPDEYGKVRLAVGQTDEGKKVITGACYLEVWKDLLDRATDYYNLSEDQKKKAQEVYDQYATGLRHYLADNLDDIDGHFKSLDHYEKAVKAGNHGTEFQQERLLAWRNKLRSESQGWLGDLDSMGADYQQALWKGLDEDQQAKGPLSMEAIGPEKLPFPIPFVKSRQDLINKAVMYGLTAIGACLILGLFTRLAAIGGGLFMISILLTQPPWPTIYPPAPDVVGHALGVDKNFIEMVALFLLATTAAGRWGGLDFFLYRWLVRPFSSRNDSDDQE